MAPLAAHMQTAPPRLPPARQGSVIACFVTSHVIMVSHQADMYSVAHTPTGLD